MLIVEIIALFAYYNGDFYVFREIAEIILRTQLEMTILSDFEALEKKLEQLKFVMS